LGGRATLEEIPLTYPEAIDADGTVVAGHLYDFDTDDEYAAEWRASSGLRVLSSDNRSVATIVSGDGTSVFGYLSSESSAMRWIDGEPYPLGIPAQSSATDPYLHVKLIAADATGTLLVGWVSDSQHMQAFLWSADTGFDVFGVDGSEATGISADGSMVVGNRAVNGQQLGFRFTVATRSYEDLDTLPGALRCRVNSVSADGLVPVGWCVLSETLDDVQSSAVRWVGRTPIDLGSLPTDPYANTALSANFDGSLIRGSTPGWTPWLWDATNGVQPTAGILAASGLDLGEWSGLMVYAMSSDGKTLVGRGTRSGVAKAFIARLP
jgi:uncharacterized membrane protein